MDTQLLPAYPKDAPLLTVIAIASKGYWEYAEKDMISWIPDLVVSEEAIEKHRVYKLIKGKEVVGFYLVKDNGSSIAILEYLFVLPQFIGKGYGALLLQHAIQKVKASTMQFIEVLSDPNAEGFYANFGFKKVEEKQSSIPGRFLPLMLLEV